MYAQTPDVKKKKPSTLTTTVAAVATVNYCGGICYGLIWYSQL